MLIRHSKPTKYDHCSIGTVCKVISSLDDNFDIYLQTNINEDEPDWLLVGTFSKNEDHLIESEIKKVSR